MQQKELTLEERLLRLANHVRQAYFTTDGTSPEDYDALDFVADVEKLQDALKELQERTEMMARYNEAMEPSITSTAATLADSFGGYCFECGSGEEYVLAYINTHDKDQKALLEEAKNLKDAYKQEVVNLCLSSDYDIFVPWYKAFLKYCANEEEVNNASLNFRANDILSYYKKGFDKVKDIE